MLNETFFNFAHNFLHGQGARGNCAPESTRSPATLAAFALKFGRYLTEKIDYADVFLQSIAMFILSRTCYPWLLLTLVILAGVACLTACLCG